MEITEKIYVITAEDWRKWLENNHSTAREIWLVYPNKKSNKPRISYNEAVEEALCFGWIDSTMKSVDSDHAAQRFSPRRKKNELSELNKERIRRLIKAGKMTPAGFQSIQQHLDIDLDNNQTPKVFEMPEDIVSLLRTDTTVWQNFEKFPPHYQHIRIAWIDAARKRPEEFNKRLAYFIKMTAKNKMYGMVL